MWRLCIEMLTRPHGYPQGMDLYESGDCIDKIQLGSQLDHYAEQVKFFEQAFDWNLMAYMFYDYFWAHCDKWKKLFELDDSVDHIFRAFLKSGMGRVVVPIREGFETSVVYYMKSGEIWNGTGMVLVRSPLLGSSD